MIDMFVGLMNALVPIFLIGVVLRAITRGRNQQTRSSSDAPQSAASRDSHAYRLQSAPYSTARPRVTASAQPRFNERLPGERVRPPLSAVVRPSQIGEYAERWFNNLTDPLERQLLRQEPQPKQEPTPKIADAGHKTAFQLEVQADRRAHEGGASGSMNYQSPEGECFDHPEHDRPNRPAALAEPQSVVPNMDLALDSPSVLGYIVFNEMLAKPVSMRRHRARMVAR
ncbi:hypothetical protein AGMMS49992_20710 [Clostridia bacterium]|nr:hypothetical protein AGMMS49992_20710 [Clostridia bacterium]